MAVDPRDFEKFMNQARIKLTGSSDSGIKTELFDVLKEFLEDSSAWTEIIHFQAVAATHNYLLVPHDAGQIIRLVGVYDHKRIPVPAFMEHFGSVHILHAPNSTPPDRWIARVVMNVAVPTTRDDIPIIPKFLLPVYSITILDGLLGKMMAQKNKSYSSDTGSTYHLRRFRTGIQIAKTAATHQNTVGAQAWAFPRGWASRGQRGGVSTAWPQSNGF